MPNTRRGSRGIPGVTSEQLSDRLSKGYLDFAFGLGDEIQDFRARAAERRARPVGELVLDELKNLYQPGAIGIGDLPVRLLVTPGLIV